jgi:hypothetical protein
VDVVSTWTLCRHDVVSTRVDMDVAHGRRTWTSHMDVAHGRCVDTCRHVDTNMAAKQRRKRVTTFYKKLSPSYVVVWQPCLCRHVDTCRHNVHVRRPCATSMCDVHVRRPCRHVSTQRHVDTTSMSTQRPHAVHIHDVSEVFEGGFEGF